MWNNDLETFEHKWKIGIAGPAILFILCSSITAILFSMDQFIFPLIISSPLTFSQIKGIKSTLSLEFQNTQKDKTILNKT